MIMFNYLSDKSWETTHSVQFLQLWRCPCRETQDCCIGKLPTLTVLLNIRDFAVATRSNKLSNILRGVVFKFRCIPAMFLFVCHCERCELWYPKLHARWLDDSVMLANHSKTSRQVALLHENPSGFKAALQSRNVLSKNSKFLCLNPELRMATAQTFKVNTIRCDLAWLPACNKECHQQ